MQDQPRLDGRALRCVAEVIADEIDPSAHGSETARLLWVLAGHLDRIATALERTAEVLQAADDRAAALEGM